MRYMMFVEDVATWPVLRHRDPARLGAGGLTPRMGRYNEELTKAGVLLALDSLGARDTGQAGRFSRPAITTVGDWTER